MQNRFVKKLDLFYTAHIKLTKKEEYNFFVQTFSNLML
jgi:hypothetical protein